METFSVTRGNLSFLKCILNLGLATALTVVLAVFTVTYFSRYLDFL